MNNIGKDEQGNTNKLLRFPSPLEYALLYTEENGFDPKTEQEGKDSGNNTKPTFAFQLSYVHLSFNL